MRIQGMLTVEGIRLHVDIESFDNERELFVTNVHPSCLVIPRERWRVEFLGLPQHVLAELRENGILTLDRLVDEEWNLDRRKIKVSLSEETWQALSYSLETLREIALVFDMPKDPSEPRLLEAVFSPKRKEEREEAERVSRVSEDEDIRVLTLSSATERTLRKYHGVNAIRDLLGLRYEQLIMTRGIDEVEIQKIKAALERLGVAVEGRWDHA